MTDASAMPCRETGLRRKATRNSPLFGLDYVELGASSLELTVCFLGKAPSDLSAASLRVEGGRRVRDIRVKSVRFLRATEMDADDRMLVGIDRVGDASTYRLRVVALDAQGRPLDATPANFDPRYDRVSFTFGVDCPSELDCKTAPPCAAPSDPEPVIDYLAKDYASFRQLMLDRLSLLVPDWQERHLPDVGVTLVELIAYVADRLSYYQDAVATEAYLDTARTRLSLRRHLRLVDYVLHEGCNARAWLAFDVAGRLDLVRDSFYAVTADAADGVGPMVGEDEWLARAASADAVAFEPVWPADAASLTLLPERNSIRLYTWLGSECCLPKGATRATLFDPGVYPQADPTPAKAAQPAIAPVHVLALKPCDVLIFEELKGPETGLPADADPTHRHAVRLTRAEKQVDPVPDPVTGKPTLIWEIAWDEQDALPFAVCISTVAPAPSCQVLNDVSMVRGNVLLVDHGRTFEEGLGQVPTERTLSNCEGPCGGAEVSKHPGHYRPTLDKTDVTYAEPIAACWGAADGCSQALPLSAASLFQRDPRRATPAVELTALPAAPNGQPAFSPLDALDPSQLAATLVRRQPQPDPLGPAAWLWGQLPRALKRGLEQWSAGPTDTPLPLALREGLQALLAALQSDWSARVDLLGSGPDDRHFVVEIDDERRAQLRFGDGDCGALPPPAALFRARYRYGNGATGNVGADAITRLVFREQLPDGADLRLRNPLPASGGTAYESATDAKLRGPNAFRRELERAITAEDYATIAARDFPSKVQRAAAVMRWNGHMSEVHVAIDPFQSAACDAALFCRIERHLQRYRRIAHDVHVVAATRVPLRLRIHVCVLPDYARGHVEAALLALLSNRSLPDGTLGFFHDDKLSFGRAIYASQIVALVQRTQGVVSARIDVLERYWNGPNGELESGLLPLGPLEVAQLDNATTAPERGVLSFEMEGGR